MDKPWQKPFAVTVTHNFASSHMRGQCHKFIWVKMYIIIFNCLYNYKQYHTYVH